MAVTHAFALMTGALFLLGSAVQSQPDVSLDTRVQSFLAARRGTWRDMNVPDVDGQTLHDLILKNKFRRAVEIGTSTGHSGIWLAWGLSKTGGRLITIDIDERRQGIALQNFKEAGVSDYIDARLGDAHQLVPQLEGPIDFVFSDADKEWYTQYFDALWPKMSAGGCFAAHNVTMSQPGIREFLEHLKSIRDGHTTFDNKSSAGISITCKKASQGRP